MLRQVGERKMIALNIRFQIAALCILIAMLVDYGQNPHLKLLSNKCFKILIVTTIIYLGLDITTVYTIINLDCIPGWVNDVAHLLFIVALIICLFLYYSYIVVLANNQMRLDRKQLVRGLAPIVVSLPFFLTGNIAYYRGADGIYSYGSSVIPLYICGLSYLILGLGMTFDKKNALTEQQRKSIRFGFTIWLIALALQMIRKTLLISGIGFTMLLLVTYFSFENQKENYDVETKCFNQNAFHKMLTEYYGVGRKLYLINVVCENYDRVGALLGHEKGISALVYIKELVLNYLGETVYRSRDDSFSLFMSGELQEEERKQKLERLEYALTQNNFKEAELKCHIDVMAIHSFIEKKDEVYELINFMAEHRSPEQSIIQYLDKGIIDKKRRREKIEEILNDALENNKFEMFYQPIYWPKEKKIKSAEALIRLPIDPELGYISPEEFIPIAEEKGLILRIGDKVIEMVADMIKRYGLEASQLEYIEVNLSGIQIVAPNIEKRLMNILERYEVSPSFINLEITETATISSGNALVTNMKKLKEKGFSFSMDDFGTGYSNLAQVSSIQYDLIKLDKSLIWPAFEPNNIKAVNLLDSVISMLQRMEIAIVAEGVETKEMVEALSMKGVAHLQGYYFSKPVDKLSFLKLLDTAI